MESKHNIIQVENVKPKISKGRKAKRTLGLLLLITTGVAVFAIISLFTIPKLERIKDYTTAEVTTGQLIATTEASGTVVLPIQVDIVSPENGYADKLLVEEGDSITPSDILAVLDVPDLYDRYDELTVNLNQALIELENIELEYDFQIKNLMRIILRLEKDILEAKEDVQTMKELSELKSSRQSDFEDSVDILEDLTELKEDEDFSLEAAILRKEIELRKQQAAIDQISVNLRIVLVEIEDVSIKSPISGEVLSINGNLAISGSSIETTDILFVVADRSNAYIDFDVYEQYAGNLETGGKMSVAIGTTSFDGEIVKIGRIATLDTDGLAAMITVRAKPLTDLSLTPGASAVASITLGVENDVLLLPRGAYLTTGSQKWVYKVGNGKAVKTAVVYGDIQGSVVEILSGLQSGDVVIISGYQNYIDQNEIELDQEIE